MLFIKILLIIFLFYVLLWVIIPKGFFIYEMLRLPFWAYKMETYPRSRCKVKKYKYGKHFRQYLLYYYPENGQVEREDVVVYFHGGGWQFGRPEMFRPNAQELVKKGYSVFLPSHRRIPFYRIRQQREDAALAIKKIMDIMEGEELGHRKIVLGGMSSGANLAGLLTYDPSLLSIVGLDRSVFRAVFLLGAPVNLAGMWHSPPLWLLSGPRSGEAFRLANPMNFIQPGDELPLLIVHPEKDGLVEPASVWEFYKKLEELNCRNIEFHILPNAIHTDAASWCFTDKQAHKLVFDWLEGLEAGRT